MSLKKVVSSVSGCMQEVHITKHIFSSHLVAFRIANSKKSHYCSVETLVKHCPPDCIKIVLLAHGANLVSQWLEPGTPERGCITRALSPCPLKGGGNGGTGALTYQYHK